MERFLQFDNNAYLLVYRNFGIVAKASNDFRQKQRLGFGRFGDAFDTNSKQRNAIFVQTSKL